MTRRHPFQIVSALFAYMAQMSLRLLPIQRRHVQTQAYWAQLNFNELGRAPAASPRGLLLTVRRTIINGSLYPAKSETIKRIRRGKRGERQS